MSKGALKNAHFAYLDGFRGLAIIGVVSTHVVVVLPALPQLFDNLTHFGSKGVQLFFMVSGLTLAINYGNGQLDKRAFFERRFFRIAPMYFLAALFYAWFTRFGLAYGVKDLSIGSWIATFTFTSGWFPRYIITFVPGGWSISNEATFYLFFPLLIGLVRRPRMLWLATISSILASVLTYKVITVSKVGGPSFNSYFAYFFWLTQLPAFLLGIALYDAIPRLKKFQREAKIAFVVLFAVTVLCAASRGAFSSYITADILFFGLILTGAISDFPALSSSALTKIGQVSFSIYLVHFAVLSCVAPVAKWLLPYGSACALVLMYFLVFALSTLISLVTYRFVERPGIRLGRKISDGYRKPLYAADSSAS